MNSCGPIPQNAEKIRYLNLGYVKSRSISEIGRSVEVVGMGGFTVLVQFIRSPLWAIKQDRVVSTGRFKGFVGQINSDPNS